MKDKKLFKKALEGLVTEHTKTQKNILREVLKKNNGQGAFGDQPPANYSPQICDDKKRKALFVTTMQGGNENWFKVLELD